MDYLKIEIFVSNKGTVYPSHLFDPEQHELNTRVIYSGLEFVQSPQYHQLEFLRKQVSDLQLERVKYAESFKQQLSSMKEVQSELSGRQDQENERLNLYTEQRQQLFKEREQELRDMNQRLRTEFDARILDVK